MNKYVFDSGNFNVNKYRRSFSSWVWRILRWLVFFIFLTSLAYYFISLFVNTDKEKQLVIENRLYKTMYDSLLNRQLLNGQAIKYLQLKDNEVYKNIFHTDAPQLQDMEISYDDLKIDTIQTKHIINQTSNVADNLLERSNIITKRLQSSLRHFYDKNIDCIPLSSPIDSLNYVNVGACIGRKFSPFLKIETYHDGLDLIAPLGANVYATADGVVTNVINQKQGLGNIVVISHKGGYVTRYAHLSSIKVQKGNKVVKGKLIGTVGASGLSFAPHLHYEILKDDKVKNPIHYLFGDLTPNEYVRVVYMSKNTQQALD